LILGLKRKSLREKIRGHASLGHVKGKGKNSGFILYFYSLNKKKYIIEPK